MSGSSKSSQTTRSVVLAFLSLWSIISLIIIVVWATRPDLKMGSGSSSSSAVSSDCRTQLLITEETLRRSEENSRQDRLALESMVLGLRENLTAVEEQRNLLTLLLDTTNSTLERCSLDNDNLRQNISVLEQHIESHIQTERNLTAVISDLQDTVELLQQNVTELTLHGQVCQSLRLAAESHMTAAVLNTTACNQSKQFLHKQLIRCKDDVAAATAAAVAEKRRAAQTQEEQGDNKEKNGSSHLQMFSLMLFLCWSVTVLV